PAAVSITRERRRSDGSRVRSTNPRASSPLMVATTMAGALPSSRAGSLQANHPAQRGRNHPSQPRLFPGEAASGRELLLARQPAIEADAVLALVAGKGHRPAR